MSATLDKIDDAIENILEDMDERPLSENELKSAKTTNALTAQPTATNIIYDIDADVVAELKAEQEAIIAALPEDIEKVDIEIIKKAKRKSVKLRTSTEAKRKEYKAWVLSYGRLVDSKAQDALDPVTEIEKNYDNLITKYNEHFENLARIAAEKEALRISELEGFIADLNHYKTLSPDSTADHIDRNITALHVWSQEVAPTIDFAEFKEVAAQAFDSSLAYLTNIHNAAVKREAAQAELDAQRTAQAEAQAKLDAERAAFAEQQRQAQLAIDERNRAENERLAKERRELEDLRIVAETAERARLQKIEDDARAERIAKENAELEEKRKKSAEEETVRLQKMLKEEDERKAKQAAEDNIKKYASDLLTALEDILNSDMAQHAEDEGNVCEELEHARHVVKLARGVK